MADDYRRRGYRVAHDRWRGRRGELDVVVKDGPGLVFVEVKQSRDFDRALSHVTARKIRRWQDAAQEYLAKFDLPQNTHMRFDVALVDQYGQIRVIENALSP